MTDDATSDQTLDSAGDRLAAEVRRLRNAAGLSQRELARLCGYTREYVSMAERPGNIASHELVRALDSALNADGNLLELRARAKAEQHSLRESNLSNSDTSVLLDAASNVGDRIYRNAHGSTPAGQLLGAEQELFNPGDHDNVPVDVTAVRAMAAAFQIADRRVGGGVLYGQVLRYLKTEIGPRLVNGDWSVGAELFAAACSLTELAGWMAHDGGDDDAARNHFGRAYRLASAAEHAPLVGNVCASMAHLAGQLNQPADAVRIAGVGLTYAVGAPGTMRLVARLHAMRARGLAAQGDRHACGTALDEAERILAAVGGEEPAEWIAAFDQASLASEAALCLRQLGDLDGAERQAKLVLRLRIGDRVRSRAFGQLTLAGVLVDAGRVDEAAAIGTELCQVASQLTSARVRTRLERLGVVLGPHAGVPEVTAFLDAVEAVVPQPAAADVRWPV